MIKFVRVASFLIAAVVTVFSIFFINAEQELAEARLAYQSGDMDQAIRKARRANRVFSEDDKKVSAYYVQAQAAEKMNWTEKAKDYLDKLLILDPNNTSGLLYRGEIALRLGENEIALRDLDKGITQADGKINPNDLAYSLSKRGLSHLALNQTNEAEADARKALELSINLPEVYDLLSRVYEEKGEINKALAACERARELSIEKNNLSFMTPEGQKLSERLVDLRVKALIMK